MLKSVAAQNYVEEESFNVADRSMLMNLKKVDFELYFRNCLNVCVLDGVWLTVYGGTPECPSFTLKESIRTYDEMGNFWEKVINEANYSSWTKVYIEFKYRMVFLEKFYKVNGLKRRQVGIGF